MAVATSGLAGALAANSAQAAPAGLATAISAAAHGATVAPSTLTLIKGTLHMMTWTKLKLALGVAAVLLLAAGAATLAISAGTNKPAATIPATGPDDLIVPGASVERSPETPT